VRTTRVQHRRVEERKQSAYLWLKLAVLAAALVAAWVYARYRAMRLLYPAEVEWFSKRYTLGPRPAGAENYSLDCLLVSAEYPAFAHAFRSQACGSLPQTSAIFLLTMLQMFGDKMEGVHYSGDRAQLRGAKADDFVKTFSAWNVPDNPWRFLFSTPSKFARSPAVQKARSSPNGDTMLSSLFNGGLCAVATQFYDPDVDASQMCRELLDEELVYFQSCAAAKAATAVQWGSTIGTLSSIGTAVPVATAVSTAAMSLTGASTAATGAAGLSALTGETAACVASGPFYPLCVLAFGVVTIVAITAVSTAITAATSSVIYAAVPCPFSQHYVLVRQPDGSYKKEAWHGDVADLPPRLKPGGEGGNEKAHHATK
jgi:hypothetical protein